MDTYIIIHISKFTCSLVIPLFWCTVQAAVSVTFLGMQFVMNVTDKFIYDNIEKIGEIADPLEIPTLVR